MKGLRNRTVFHKLVIGVLWGAEVEVGVTGIYGGLIMGGLECPISISSILGRHGKCFLCKLSYFSIKVMCFLFI